MMPYSTPLQLHSSPDPIDQLTTQLLLRLQHLDSPTTLLLSGGSAVKLYQQLTDKLPADLDLSQLSVSLIDERWVPIGHEHSNEQQIRETGFISAVEARGGKWFSILTGLAGPSETIRFNSLMEELFSASDQIIGILGLGEDGHTAGILPQTSQQAFDQIFAGPSHYVYYDVDIDYPNPFKHRITISPSGLSHVNDRYLLAMGDKKQPILEQLRHDNPPRYQFPATLLRDKPLAVYTDVHMSDV